jgi:hypothetical protein
VAEHDLALGVRVRRAQQLTDQSRQPPFRTFHARRLAPPARAVWTAKPRAGSFGW